MIFYTLDKTVDLKEIPTPKFVYMHVMLPHLPISFDRNGNLEDLKYREDWSYYLGQHQYATKRAEELVTKILQNADAQRPPIIVLQSDHGARNEEPNSSDGKPLQNYDEKYKTSIMNALYLPGFDYSTLTQDMDPLTTFEIILNHYFNANVKVDLSASGQ